VIFHSLDFIVFFLVVVAVYWRLPHRGQNALLLAASYFFYGYIHPWFVGLILTTTVVDYWAARGIQDRPDRRKVMLGLSLGANLSLLGFFKYFNFFAENVQEVLALVGLNVSAPVLRVILPVGISFYTFQALSYTIDVYRGRLHARRNFIDFATFVALFPQLVAGPIERATHLLPQVEAGRRHSWEATRDGLLLAVWGYFKKLVIADNVGIIANKVFSLQDPGFAMVWAGVFAFAIQIYADFSAYSDIARGVARCFGFSLMRNFDHPYLATGRLAGRADVAPKSISAWLKSKTCLCGTSAARDRPEPLLHRVALGGRPCRRTRGTARARRWCRGWPRAGRNAKLRMAPAV
jgi:alginate O-acetyltransferase complex protein AlgI